MYDKEIITTSFNYTVLPDTWIRNYETDTNYGTIFKLYCGNNIPKGLMASLEMLDVKMM